MSNKDKVIFKLEIELFDDVFFDHTVGCYYFLNAKNREKFVNKYKQIHEPSLNNKLNYHYIFETNVLSNLKKEITVEEYEELFGVEL